MPPAQTGERTKSISALVFRRRAAKGREGFTPHEPTGEQRLLAIQAPAQGTCLPTI